MRAEFLEDGKVKYVEEFKHPITGKRKRVSVTYTKDSKKNQQLAYKELILKVEEKKKELMAGATDDFKPITIKELSEKFLKDKEYLKESTQFTYKAQIQSLMNIIDGDFDVSHITLPDLNNLILQCSTKTRVKYLKMILDWGQNNNFISPFSENPFKNEFKKIKKKEGQKSVDKKMYYEIDEIDSVLAKIDEKKTYLRELLSCLIVFLLNTGLRVGEALALTFDDIDENNILTVNKTAFNLRIQSPKTLSSYREIAINEETLECIKKVDLVKKKYLVPDTNIIFSNKKGSLLAYNSLRGVLMKCLGNEFYGFHIFRHTHASILAEKQIPLDTIQRRLGHEKDDITKKIYIHVTDKTKEREYELFRNMSIR